jgi:hypothetical protein
METQVSERVSLTDVVKQQKRLLEPPDATSFEFGAVYFKMIHSASSFVINRLKLTLSTGVSPR